jgi:hypothetical protein
VVTRVVKSDQWGACVRAIIGHVYACVMFCINRRCARGGVKLGWTKVGQRRVCWSDSWFLLVFMLAYLMVQTCITREWQKTFYWFVQVGPQTTGLARPRSWKLPSISEQKIWSQSCVGAHTDFSVKREPKQRKCV